MAIIFNLGSEPKKLAKKPKPARQKPVKPIPSKKADTEKPATKLGRPPTGNAKALVSLRLDADVVEAYKATGKGWRSRINDDLRKSLGL
ncbi:BrnA antitoxin family protein [Martelella lutilitoris]|uniref:BrnA antitoxin family protein n=1 Tax=Martelella lutilitoris TaxID=2583532 RepID=A0A7T7HHN8_9HYPH|nr:BrnA antitoxin family protein [Martelella lutilitoris]QQM29309.1 BrnA antitoxin family protein [Martelella lutilitoris]